MPAYGLTYRFRFPVALRRRRRSRFSGGSLYARRRRRRVRVKGGFLPALIPLGAALISAIPGIASVAMQASQLKK
ncbi:pX [Murine mastadenovirus A]|uniref:Late L2 mu core protein n=1 Tax=Murine adenovirus A serotype 1 TaxID=10530 RepID=L2MU_ADEM1|nr:precursor to X (mu) polypeptide [Murine mastadenovirus A]AP_000349.1 pX [Murine mastadenovirus A]O10443.1 RecName: Full=Late L2 mu core protein; AltName: Full=Protein X; Short=pX; AltName: Full=pMu; Flags: Precursor [Murine adenovirus 1]AAB53758.1 pX [Murine adenovirus 1]